MSQTPESTEAPVGTVYPGDVTRLFPPVAEWCALVVECAASDYSASAIARAVEDCDARLLNLNVTADPRAAMVTAELRVARRNPESIARSLERYGYSVTGMISSSAEWPDAELNDSTAARRVAELLRYLEI